MNGKQLLDTNIVITLFNEEPAILAKLRENPDVHVPSIVIGELRFGARKSSRVEKNLARLDRFIANSAVLPCDHETALFYGDVKGSLQIKGRMIPDNDIWIAAVAKQHGLTVVSRDAHFQIIDELAVEAW